MSGGYGLSDYRSAMAVRDVIRKIAEKVVDRERPRPRYGTLVSVAGTKVEVQFPGETDTVWANAGMMMPITVGCTVKVDRLGSDRFVTDAYGAKLAKVPALEFPDYSYLGAATYAEPEQYGAVGDGVTNDYAAINAALTALSGANGGTLKLRRGKIYGIQQSLTIPANVRVIGDNRTSSRIRAIAPFTGTYVVRLGDTSVRAFGCQMTDLMIDANSLVATGVFSETINEKSGLARCLIQGATSIGVDVVSQVSGSNGLAQNFFLEELEIYMAASAVSAVTGLRLVSTALSRDFAHSVRGITCNSSDGVTILPAGSIGILIDGFQSTSIMTSHVERYTKGVSIGPNNYSHGTSVIGFYGAGSLTDCINIETNAGDSITIIGIAPMGATNTLVDTPRGTTITSASESRLGFYVVGTSNNVITSAGTPTTRLGSIRTNATGLGFFGTAPGAKATITGAKGGNVALTNLLVELAAKGLIVNSTT